MNNGSLAPAIADMDNVANTAITAAFNNFKNMVILLFKYN
jgi:hypothetical protein